MFENILKEIKRNKLRIVIASGVLTIVCVVGYIIWGMLANKAGEELSIYIQGSKIDFGILKNPAIKELEVQEEAKLPTEKGRENPFIPY